MTELLEKALAIAQGLSPERQDEIAHLMLVMAQDDGALYKLSPEDSADQDAADAEEARGEYASDEDVRAVWTKYDL